MKSAPKKLDHESLEVEYQSASIDIWDKKYRLKELSGEPIDLVMDDTFKRVAKALSIIEEPEQQENGNKSFCGLCVQAQFLLEELCPMLAQENISRQPPQSTVLFLVQYMIQ
jgi:hypothetical protein